MTPAARLQAAIELLDDIIAATRNDGAAADTLIARYFKARRYAGSKDRRAVRDHVYEAIRHYATPPERGRGAMLGLAEEQPELRVLFDGSKFGPAEIGDSESTTKQAPMLDWLRAHFADGIDESDIASLAGRAPLDIRVNAMRTSRDAVIEELQEAEAGELADRAIRLPHGYPVESQKIWHQGLIDIQDMGSQIIADSCEAKPDTTIVDLCAGAGGKTLALYDSVAGGARMIACDTNRNRLSALAPRASRCQMPGIETRLLNPGKEQSALADLTGKAELVLVDAPCSGTGTWRRNPEARWRLAPERIAGYIAQQHHILELSAPLIAPGGVLVYAVCSLLAGEGRGQISDFLRRHSDFSKVAPASPVGTACVEGYLLTPARHRTDGFFFARLQRAC